MFRVECTSCKAAYQVDERRVPPKGLTMKCPKCRESFLVSPPDKPEMAPEKASLPIPNNFSGTMIGVSARRDLLGGFARTAETSNQTQIGLQGARAPKGNDATMIGVAPSAAKDSLPPSGAATDLPAVRTPEQATPAKTGRTQDLPVSTPPGPTSRAQNTQDTAAELPAAKAQRPQQTAPFATLGAKKTSRINFSSLSPSSKPEAPKVDGPSGDGSTVDEPKPRGLKVEATKPSIDLAPKPLSPGANRLGAGGVTEAELPAVVAPRKSVPDIDLAHDLLDLPAAIGPGKAAVNSAPPSSRLHKPTHQELPAVRNVAGAAPKDQPQEPMDFDLPAVFGDRKPAAKKPEEFSKPTISDSVSLDFSDDPEEFTTASHSAPPDEVVDLDSEALESLAPSAPVAATRRGESSLDLPEVAGVGLPSVGGLDLPMVFGGNLPALSGTELPSSVGLELPDVLGGTALPSVPKGFDDAGLGFGELDLPTIGGGKSASLPPAAPLDFSAKLPSFAPSEPPAGRVSSQPPSFRARQDSFGDFDGVPSFAPSTREPAASGSLDDGGFDDGLMEGESFSLGDESQVPPESRLPSQLPKAPVTRAAPEEYGQVNLDAGPGGVGADVDDEMEFGGIPQAESEPPKGLPVDGRVDAAVLPDPAPAAVAGGRGPRVKPAKADGEAKKKTRTSVKIAAVAFGLLSVGGAALALVPELGPFGIYAAQDLFQRGEHQALQTRLGQAVDAARALDNYAGSVAAVTAMDNGRASAKRFVPLKAETAAQALAVALRFGGPASIQSTGQVLLSDLSASGADRAELRRARAVSGVLRREPSASSELGALPRDLFTLTVEGEHWLRVENTEKAIVTWTEAANQKRCAWTLFGLARAYLSGNQLEQALTAAKQTLELNSEHVGAKLLLLDAALRAGEPDPATTSTAESIASSPASASPAEIALAHTLAGEFELAEGRTSKAIDVFEEALKIVPGDPRALTSSARALFSAGRHAAALARFQAAVTAAPEAIGPKVGVIRAQLATEQLDQAVAQIQSLRQAFPKDIEIAYLSGFAALASGDTDVGRKVLQEAIELSKQQRPARFAKPAFAQVAVDAYVTLASSFTKAGEPDRAAPVLAQAAAELPGSSALRVATGDVAFGQGQFEKALAEYVEARKLAASDTAALFKEGQALSRLRRFDEAREVFERVAAVDSAYPGLPLEKGLLLDRAGKAAEALAEYERALEKDPADVDVQLRVGCGRVVAGQGTQAVNILKDVALKRPRSAEASYCLGRAMFAQGSNVEALQLMRSAVEFDANSATYRLHLGWIASEMGQVAVARRELNRALELDQGSVDAYWQRGLLNLKQGAARDAMVDFKKALELNSGHLAANADMAQALAQLGKENDSLPYWEKAVNGDGNNPTWLFRYGKVLVGRHQGEKGTELLLRALKLVEGQAPAPNWAWQAQYLAALGLGSKPQAAQHWRRYLEMSPHDSPYRGEAKRALAKAGQPWEGQ